MAQITTKEYVKKVCEKWIEIGASETPRMYKIMKDELLSIDTHWEIPARALNYLLKAVEVCGGAASMGMSIGLLKQLRDSIENNEEIWANY
ncbi:hypothetical protein AGMMS49573_11040 [Endomicrobiia bacterium]|nr:hypothetical protein AGMMS49573_11040 [Endomicrobiia bacterium]